MFISTQMILNKYGPKWVQQLQDNIINDHAHGNYVPLAQREKMASSVEYQVGENDFTIMADQWIFTYEYGRGPTVNDGDGAVRRNVRAYIRENNIQPQGYKANGDTIDEDTLAFFISQKIHQYGSKLFRDHQQSGVLSSVINDQNIEDLLKDLNTVLVPSVASILLEGVSNG